MTLSQLINQLGEQGVSIEFQKNSKLEEDFAVQVRETFISPHSGRQICVIYKDSVDVVVDRLYEMLKVNGAFDPIRRYVVKQVEPQS